MTMNVDVTPTPQDETPFAGVPAWERGRTRRTSVGRAPAARSVGKSNMGPIAAGAAVVLLAGAAAVTWYATRPHEQTVAELTPGDAAGPASATDAVTASPAESSAAPAPAEMAQAAPAPAQTRTMPPAARTPSRTEGAQPANRSRAVTRSAGDNAADVSATAPVRAQPAPNPSPAPLVLSLRCRACPSREPPFHTSQT